MPGFNKNDPRFSATGSLFHKKIIFPLYEEGLGRYRYYLLNQLNMFDVHYYGRMNWHASHITFHPPVNYLVDLPQIYRSTVVNLDIPAFQSIHSVNNRFFDVGAAGSLVLTEKRADLMAIFDDFETITYTCIDSLKEKIGFYLENTGTRNQVAQKLHRSVCQNHTYTDRASYLLETLWP
jgi:spore maturation protein CgeB